MPCLDDRGVAVVDGDVFDRHAELVGEHLREGGLVALAVRRRAGGGADAAVALHRHLGVLPATGGQEEGRPQAADLDVHRQPEADDAALGPGGVAVPLHLRPVGHLQRMVERLLVVARVVDRAHLGLIRELARLDEVLPPHVGRLHAQLARQHVHRALHEVRGFGTAGAAIGIGRRLVGEDLAERDANRRDVVGGVGHQHRQRRDHRREQHVVGAHVGNQPQFQPQHRAVAFRRQVHVAEDVAAVDRGDERFGPVLDPLDRQLQLPGQRRRHELFAVDVDLGAEPTAHLRGDGAHLVLAHAEHRRDDRPQHVRALRRRPDGHRALAGLEVRHHAARFHGTRRQAVIDHALRDHDLGIGEGLVDRRIVHRAASRSRATWNAVQQEIVREPFVHEHRLARHRQLGIHHRRQRIVGHHDGVGGIAGQVPVTRDHHGHGFAPVADRVGGDRTMLRRSVRRADGHRAGSGPPVACR